MSKKLKIQFWKAEKALAMQTLEQEGLHQKIYNGEACILVSPQLLTDCICLRGSAKWSDLKITKIKFDTNAERDAYLDKVVNAITDKLFTGEGELRIEPTVEECGQLVTYTWEEK